jgi:hypothetical protein
MQLIRYFSFAAALVPADALADGYVMGAGRWPCTEVVRVADQGNSSEIGQLAGWLMGFWTAATFTRETGFIDTVEAAGGRKILDATVAECRKAPGSTLLYKLSRSMIDNTK